MQKFYGRFLEGAPAIGLLIFRIVIGAALMIHGWSKIQHPFNWMNQPGKPPSPIPGPLQALAALGEFGGGAGILFGCLTPLACLGVICTMLGAYFIVHRGAPWITPAGKSFELASLYGIMALLLAFTGPGVFSLDAFLFGKKKKY